MPTRPDTKKIANAIKALAQTSLFEPALSNGATTYKKINIGALKDYTEVYPLLEIEGRGRASKRYAQGGKIESKQRFLLRSVINYTNTSNTAEEDIFTICDAIEPLFHEHARLNDMSFNSGIIDSRIVEDSGAFGFIMRNGVWWRAYEFMVVVTYEYTVTIVP